jgi:hypothetical protein
VGGGQPGDAPVKGDDVVVFGLTAVGRGGGVLIVQRQTETSAAVTLGFRLAGAIHEDAAHADRGGGEEVASVLERLGGRVGLRGLGGKEFDVGLVDQRRRLQRERLAGGIGDLTACDGVELVVDQVGESIGGGGGAGAGLGEQSGDVLRFRACHRPDSDGIGRDF